jgi:hypothetical protein
VRLLGLVLIAWVLSACATGPADPSLDAEAKLLQAPADKACIYVVPSNSTIAVAVSMDGRNVATLEAASFLRLDVPPGRHVLAATLASLLPAFLRETPDTIPVDAEVGHCYFLRTLWREDERSWRSYRVYWATMTEAEGQREIDILRLTLPTK